MKNRIKSKNKRSKSSTKRVNMRSRSNDYSDTSFDNDRREEVTTKNGVSVTEFLIGKQMTSFLEQEMKNVEISNNQRDQIDRGLKSKCKIVEESFPVIDISKAFTRNMKASTLKNFVKNRSLFIESDINIYHEIKEGDLSIGKEKENLVFVCAKIEKRLRIISRYEKRYVEEQNEIEKLRSADDYFGADPEFSKLNHKQRMALHETIGSIRSKLAKEADEFASEQMKEFRRKQQERERELELKKMKLMEEKEELRKIEEEKEKERAKEIEAKAKEYKKQMLEKRKKRGELIKERDRKMKSIQRKMEEEEKERIRLEKEKKDEMYEKLRKMKLKKKIDYDELRRQEETVRMRLMERNRSQSKKRKRVAQSSGDINSKYLIELLKKDKSNTYGIKERINKENRKKARDYSEKVKRKFLPRKESQIEDIYEEMKRKAHFGRYLREERVRKMEANKGLEDKFFLYGKRKLKQKPPSRKKREKSGNIFHKEASKTEKSTGNLSLKSGNAIQMMIEEEKRKRKKAEEKKRKELEEKEKIRKKKEEEAKHFMEDVRKEFKLRKSVNDWERYMKRQKKKTKGKEEDKVTDFEDYQKVILEAQRLEQEAKRQEELMMYAKEALDKNQDAERKGPRPDVDSLYFNSIKAKLAVLNNI